MVRKKGQITLFIILGLVILVLSLMAYIVSLNTQKSELTPDEVSELDVKPVREYMQRCMEEVGTDALELIGAQGGYYILPDGFDYNDAQSAVFFDNAAITPSMATIESELSDFMNEFIYDCTGEDIGFSFEEGNPITKTTVAQDKVTFNVNADLTLFQQEKSNNLQPFLVTIEPMRLGKIYDISRAIVNELVKDPETVCLSCLVELAEQNNLKIAVNMIGEKKVLFTIKDYTTDIEEPYVFRFVAQLK